MSILSLPLSANEDEESGPTSIKLESSFIGDKEQPSVSYFIPWEGIGTPDKLQWQISDKIDRTLDLVDRKVMLRSTAIYQELKLETNLKVKPESK
ncbi:hypothetical protein FLL46_23860 [Aliikangiella coralliicola]|uniref:Uncharacterized protein n=1 Tax=Aliikangiella coralliicola TaxID=2592383 RepID=A0A545U0M5_9GAMM|nr:hypothetical protein FLL46_23860 [Aliikangiella coralliicola]